MSLSHFTITANIPLSHIKKLVKSRRVTSSTCSLLIVVGFFLHYLRVTVGKTNLNIINVLFIFQFDLVCDKAIYGTISSSLIFGGWLIGAGVVGALADRFGRKFMVFSFGFLIALFSLLSASPHAYWLFAVFRLIVGISLGRYNNVHSAEDKICPSQSL